MTVDELMEGDFLDNLSDGGEGSEDEGGSEDDGLSDGVIGPFWLDSISTLRAPDVC